MCCKLYWNLPRIRTLTQKRQTQKTSSMRQPELGKTLPTFTSFYCQAFPTREAILSAQIINKQCLNLWHRKSVLLPNQRNACNISPLSREAQSQLVSADVQVSEIRHLFQVLSPIHSHDTECLECVLYVHGNSKTT